MAWRIVFADEVNRWYRKLLSTDPQAFRLVTAALTMLRESGPMLAQPLVEYVEGSKSPLKELRPGAPSNTDIRILFIVDLLKEAVILLSVEKTGEWSPWGRSAVDLAEERLIHYMKRRGER